MIYVIIWKLDWDHSSAVLPRKFSDFFYNFLFWQNTTEHLTEQFPIYHMKTLKVRAPSKYVYNMWMDLQCMQYDTHHSAQNDLNIIQVINLTVMQSKTPFELFVSQILIELKQNKMRKICRKYENTQQLIIY